MPDARAEATTDGVIRRGGIGGRTVRIVEDGTVECHRYPVPAPLDGWVCVRTVRSVISAGTELTFVGRAALNVRLRKRWNAGLRLFEPGSATAGYPITFGYRAAGEVVDSRTRDIARGTRVWGAWRHTEFTMLPAERAAAQRLPDGISIDSGVDIGQMAPICINAVLFAEGLHQGYPAVVFGAGPIGLITAQVARATGAAVVHVVDRLPSRLRIAAELGFDAVDAATDDVAATLKTQHGGNGIPVAFECTGATAALGEAIRVVRRQGTVVAAGFYQGDATDLHLGDEFHHNAVRIVGAQIGNVHPSTTRAGLSRQTVDLLERGALVLGELPRTCIPVEDVAAGFDALRRPAENLQVALTYDPES